MILHIEKALPIATRRPGSATVRGAQVLRMPDVIIEDFLRMGETGVVELAADLMGDSLRTGALLRDPGRGPVADPMPDPL
jgi:hypothetical protein